MLEIEKLTGQKVERVVVPGFGGLTLSSKPLRSMDRGGDAHVPFVQIAPPRQIGADNHRAIRDGSKSRKNCPPHFSLSESPASSNNGSSEFDITPSRKTLMTVARRGRSVMFA